MDAIPIQITRSPNTFAPINQQKKKKGEKQRKRHMTTTNYLSLDLESHVKRGRKHHNYFSFKTEILCVRMATD